MNAWYWASASCIGTAHVHNGQPLQDAHACRVLRLPVAAPVQASVQIESAPTLLIAVVSDGAGSASHGRQGAVLTCRTLTQAAIRYAERSSDQSSDRDLSTVDPAGGVQLPDEPECRRWIARLQRRIHSAASARGLQPRDFACTLVFVLSDGRRTLVLHVGDGGVVARRAEEKETALQRLVECAGAAHQAKESAATVVHDGRHEAKAPDIMKADVEGRPTPDEDTTAGRIVAPAWRVLSWPEHGEYASSTSFVTDTPADSVRMRVFVEPFDSFVLFSDGLERQVLNLEEKTPFIPFFSAVSEPPRVQAQRLRRQSAVMARVGTVVTVENEPTAVADEADAGTTETDRAQWNETSAAAGQETATGVDDEARMEQDERARTGGNIRSLSGQLLSYLDSAAVNARTDDDKTLVVAVLA
ncbi:MAG: PP2C family serine/threonine-protein phosphatase [Lautropia sp.]|nr:PP2C family serine/threonine-protein phosphatase [Lautropia sp.]